MPVPVIDVSSAANSGTYEEFATFYTGDPNVTNTFSDCGILSFCVGSRQATPDRIRIARQLLADRADVNEKDAKYARTPLHRLLFDVYPKPAAFLIEMTRVLLEAGADVDAEDRFLETPLGYAVRNTKAGTDELRPLYLDLLHAGADPRHVNTFGRSPLDYAKEYSWRNGFADIVSEFERGPQQ